MARGRRKRPKAGHAARRERVLLTMKIKQLATLQKIRKSGRREIGS